MKFLLLFCFWGAIASAQPITIPLEKAPKYPAKKKKIEGPVILDARPAFKYAMGHVQKAQPIRWEDYSQTEEPHKGALDPDTGLLARKLRLLGIKPDREVIVLGEGHRGEGQEGRIGWMLLYLGVKKVKVLNVDSFEGKKAFGPREDVDEAPLWLPKVSENMRMEKRELTPLVKEKSQGNVIIDVRSNDEFKNANPIPGAIHIPWTQLVSSDGNPLPAGDFVRLLRERQVDPAKTLVFYSDNGVASGYATYVALNAKLKARHYDGSLRQWVRDTNPVQ